MIMLMARSSRWTFTLISTCTITISSCLSNYISHHKRELSNNFAICDTCRNLATGNTHRLQSSVCNRRSLSLIGMNDDACKTFCHNLVTRQTTCSPLLYALDCLRRWTFVICHNKITKLPLLINCFYFLIHVTIKLIGLHKRKCAVNYKRASSSQFIHFKSEELITSYFSFLKKINLLEQRNMKTFAVSLHIINHFITV